MKIQTLISLARAKYRSLPPHQKPIATILPSIISIVILGLLLKGCVAIIFGKKTPPISPILIRQDKAIFIPKSSPLRNQMIVKTVKASHLPHVVSVPGNIEADPSRTIAILPPLPGRLIALNVKLGDTVKPHQILASIRSPALAQAYSDEAKARSLLILAKETLKRAQRVNHAGGNAIKDIEQAQNNYTQALAEVKRTQITLKTLSNKGFSLLNIKSPQAGMVTTLHYGKGSYINDVTTPLLTISNTTSLWVTANIPERLIGLVSKGLPVEIFFNAYPEKPVRGKIAFINANLDPDTRRNKTHIEIANPDGKLQPNMYATVKISLPQPPQVMIPISSILMNNDSTSVYVEISPWTFERREVELGAEDKENVRVLAGLRSGDRIITTGGVLVND